MKIVVRSVAVAKVPLLKLRIEGVLWNMLDLLSVIRKVTCVEITAGTDYNVYIDMPFDIQGVEDDAAAVQTYTVIKNELVELSNFATNAIGEFKKGLSYLIKNDAVAPTLIIPEIKQISLNDSTLGTAVVFYSGKYYLYLSASNMNPFNNTSVTVIQYDVNVANVLANQAKKESENSADMAAFKASQM